MWPGQCNLTHQNALIAIILQACDCELLSLSSVNIPYKKKHTQMYPYKDTYTNTHINLKTLQMEASSLARHREKCVWGRGLYEEIGIWIECDFSFQVGSVHTCIHYVLSYPRVWGYMSSWFISYLLIPAQSTLGRPYITVWERH